MLATKLISSYSTPNIEFVGAYFSGYAGTTSNIDVPLNSLSNGIATSPSVGDIVIVFFCIAHGDTFPTISGYDTIQQILADDDYNSLLYVAKKRLSSADSSFTIVGGTINAAYAACVSVFVFRNADYASHTTSSGVNGVYVDPPAITPNINGAFVVSGGACATVAPPDFAISASFDHQIGGKADDTYDCSMLVGYKGLVSGTFDPPAFTLSGGDTSLKASWTACSVALAPSSY